MADTVRERILEATYACIARNGMARTTVEDARVMLSFIAAEGRWDLTDRDQVAALVRTEFLSGVVH
jgi:hypothetical protein